MIEIEKIIINKLLYDDQYARKVLPFLKTEYFRGNSPSRVAYELVSEYISAYNSLPSADAMVVELKSRENLSEDLFRDTATLLGEVLSGESDVKREWMIDQTETWCRDRALHNAVSESLEIIKSKGETGLSRSGIPKLFQDALAIDFDPRLGHDYLRDRNERWRSYHDTTSRLPFDLKAMNEITQGGLMKGTLNVIMATSNVGKTLFLCHCAANNLAMGKNVLYVSLETAEMQVGLRLDANLMGVPMNAVKDMGQAVWDRKLADIEAKTGRLIVKEYSKANCGHIRSLLSELKLKQGFVPDVLYVDYINIMSSNSKRELNSYEKVKEIAEDLRAIGTDWGIPVFSATQTNRVGYNTSSPGMDNVSESLGLPMTADLFIAILQNEILERMGQYKCLQLKSRYDDKGKKPVFYLGVHKTTQRLYDVESSGVEVEEGEEIQAIRSAVNKSTPGGGLDFSGYR